MTSQYARPPIVQFNEEPNSFALFVLKLRLQEQPCKQDRVLYLSYPVEGGLRPVRLVADANGNIDQRVVNGSGVCTDADHVAAVCDDDWANWVEPIIRGLPIRNRGNAAPLKVPQ
jgi:hypothetical protein